MSIASSDAGSYTGLIQNVSEEGLAYGTNSFAPMLKNLSPKKIINLILKMPSGESLNLNCEIKWSSLLASPWPLPLDYATFKMGMKIIDPPLDSCPKNSLYSDICICINSFCSFSSIYFNLSK